MNPAIYVDYNIWDFQGNQTLSSYALPQTPFTFAPVLTSSLTVISQKRVMWDFGDGTTSTDVEASHSYTWPGIYKVSLVVYDYKGKAYVSTYSPTVSVIDFVNNQLTLDTPGTIQLNIAAGQLAPILITRSNSWQTYKSLSAIGYSVNLYVSGSSDPLVDINSYYNFGWSHLVQQCYFYDRRVAADTYEYIPVSNIVTNIVPIYAGLDSNNDLYLSNASDPGAFFVGSSGTATAYFTSNYPKHYNGSESPLIIFASLNSKGLQDPLTQRVNYYNYNEPLAIGYLNTAPATLYAYVRYNPATQISFSTNGIDSYGDAMLSTFAMPQLSWQNTVIPFVAKLEDKTGHSTLFYPLLSSLSFSISLNTPSKILPITFNPDFLTTLPQNVGGYYKGNFSCASAATTVWLAATATVTDPAFYSLSPIQTVIGSTSGSFGFAQQDVIKSQGSALTQAPGLAPVFNIPQNIKSFAVAPSANYGYKNHALWGINNDNAYVLDYRGNILNTINLPQLVNFSGSVSATSIAIDGENYAWISLSNASSVIKIDAFGNLLAAVGPSIFNSTTALNFTQSSFNSALSAAYPLFSPGYVETDINNNVWVTYRHPKYAYTIRCNSGGAVQYGPIGVDYSPSEKIMCDKYANTYRVYFDDSYGYFLNGDKTSTLGASALSAVVNPSLPNSYVRIHPSVGGDTLVGPFSSITTTTIDRNNYIWVGYAPNTFSQLSADGTAYSSITVGNFDTSNKLPVLQNSFVDAYNRLYTYNNYDNVWYCYDITNQRFITLNALSADYINCGDDFTGSRWIDKYAFTSTRTRNITGVSNTFAINPATGIYSIAKQNENFDMANFLYSLKLPEYLVADDVMFKTFWGTIVGSYSAQPYELGKTFYERIANFGDNTSNIDTATVDAVVSMSQQMGVQLADVNYQYPPQLRRIVDLLSIKRSKLFGNLNQYRFNFSSTVGLTPDNLGVALNLKTDTFSLSESLVAYERFSNQFSLVKLPQLSTFPQNEQFSFTNYSSAWGLPVVVPADIEGLDIGNYYDFFRYKNSISSGILDSVINWADTNNNTLNFYNSSYQTWSMNDGIMDSIINYEMTKGLKLFTSGPIY